MITQDARDEPALLTLSMICLMVWRRMIPELRWSVPASLGSLSANRVRGVSAAGTPRWNPQACNVIRQQRGRTGELKQIRLLPGELLSSHIGDGPEDHNRSQETGLKRNNMK